MTLSVIIPSKTLDDPQLRDLLDDLESQDFPKDQVEIIVETKGNPEQAKGYAINRARGDVLGFFCTDNRILDKKFLKRMLWWTTYSGIHGSYTSSYSYIPTDKPLSRYFSLIGGNDPICWWLGKNDRLPWAQQPSNIFNRINSHTKSIPSIGDNGFFIRRNVFGTVNPNTHFCIDAVDDARKKQDLTFSIQTDTSLWHKTGESVWTYLKKRYRYTKELYWRDYGKRRWKMVETRKDWLAVGAFALCSVLVIPHLVVSLIGYSKSKDVAWLIHPLVCLGLTGLYLWLLVRYGIASLFRHWAGQKHSTVALTA